jgi:hypothetical protein
MNFLRKSLTVLVGVFCTMPVFADTATAQLDMTPPPPEGSLTPEQTPPFYVPASANVAPAAKPAAPAAAPATTATPAH